MSIICLVGQLRSSAGSSEYKWCASCPTGWSRETSRKGPIHFFSWGIIFALIPPRVGVGEWRCSFFSIYSHVQQRHHLKKSCIQMRARHFWKKSEVLLERRRIFWVFIFFLLVRSAVGASSYCISFLSSENKFDLFPKVSEYRKSATRLQAGMDSR